MDDFMHWIVVLSLWMTSQTLCPYFLQSLVTTSKLQAADLRITKTTTHTHTQWWKVTNYKCFHYSTWVDFFIFLKTHQNRKHNS